MIRSEQAAQRVAGWIAVGILAAGMALALALAAWAVWGIFVLRENHMVDVCQRATGQSADLCRWQIVRGERE